MPISADQTQIFKALEEHRSDLAREAKRHDDPEACQASRAESRAWSQRRLQAARAGPYSAGDPKSDARLRMDLEAGHSRKMAWRKFLSRVGGTRRNGGAGLDEGEDETTQPTPARDAHT